MRHPTLTDTGHRAFVRYQNLPALDKLLYTAFQAVGLLQITQISIY